MAGLTHHQILALIAPFTRAGHRLDLLQSDRLQRRLRFHARPVAPGLTEQLALDHPRPGRFILRSTLQRADGLCATLQAGGSDAAALLQQLQAVSVQHGFSDGDGYAIARDLQLTDQGVALPCRVRLQTAAVGLTLTLPQPVAEGAAASALIDLQVGDGSKTGNAHGPLPALPDDLLAVLGWDWSLLRADARPGHWCASVRVQGRGSAGAADLQRKLDLLAPHLVRTLAEPPPRFHDRLRAARWRVALRRSIPLLAVLAMALYALLIGPVLPAGGERGARDALLGLVHSPVHSPMQPHRMSPRVSQPSLETLTPLMPLMLLLPLLPPAALALYFLRSEAPRVAMPRWPRRARAAAW